MSPAWSAQLLRFPGLRPVVLDNGSEYPPALDLYRRWAAEGLAPGRVLVVPLGRNLGPAGGLAGRRLPARRCRGISA